MVPSNNFFRLLQQFEGLKLTAYRDSANYATIGIGTIRYPDRTPVKITDVCTEIQAHEWARYDAGKMASKLNLLLTTKVNQNQYDALLLLMYNIGAGALSRSTVLKRVNLNEGDVRAAWMLWNKAGGKVVQGLINRRIMEADLFYKPI